ncbi:Extracellular sulfatase Sulf-1 [Araneus ventricosus]|uniref:Extracellular sulfatase Sulf-1 n=1 Tax=Araneus ventricosus TaxID=182803 RepID=A0A4Y2PE29_ARAVE|nr:Extracellular sulfatase Sulf-1 [Araneus ventricosus]
MVASERYRETDLGYYINNSQDAYELRIVSGIGMRTPSWNFAPNPDKQWLLRHTGKMEPIHVKFTDVLHTKRLQTLQSVDDAVERLYRELRSLGELENTYIFYTSDHGYHLGQFGLVKGKSMPFEFDVRVPFFVRGPKVPRGVRIQDIVLNIDLAPTFLDIAGVEVPEHMDGRSVLSILKDADAWASSGHRHTEVRRKKSWRDSFLIERGVVNSQRRNAKNLYPNISPVFPKLTKDQRLAIECRKPHYSSPCKLHQKWECIHDGIRWRIQKCRMQYPAPNGCICPDQEDDLEEWDFGEFQKRPDSLLMLPPKRRKHLVQNEELQDYLALKDSKLSSGSSRWKRFVDQDTFDIKGIEQLFQLLDATVGNKTEWLGSTARDPKAPFLSRRQSGDSRTKNTQQQLSVPLIDGSTKYQVNSIFCYIHQMAARQLLQQRISPNSKPMTHFTAQSL